MDTSRAAVELALIYKMKFIVFSTKSQHGHWPAGWLAIFRQFYIIRLSDMDCSGLLNKYKLP